MLISTMKLHLTLILLIIVFLAGIAVVLVLDSDFGSLDVERIMVSDGSYEISGLLYRPNTATLDNPSPAVVLIHGISSSKRSMSSIALELARNGFVALSIDIIGHGESGGMLYASRDFSLGALAAVRYLEFQPYVDTSSLGLVGHSLGAGATRATATAHRGIKATVLIAGGIGEIVAGSAYGVLNSTFPENLLVAIGRQDVLFDLPRVTKEFLPPVFGAALEVVPGQLYGDFSSGTARKLITPLTTHLLEPLDPAIVSETVVWLKNALKTEEAGENRLLGGGLVYFYREAAMLLSVIVFSGLVFPVSLYALPGKGRNDKNEDKYGFLSDWMTMLIWGAVSMILFLPAFSLGFIVNFPPVLFGSSIAWWLLTVAIAGLLMLFILPRFAGVKLGLRKLVSKSFEWRGACSAVGLFVLLYLAVSLLDHFLGLDLWIFVPIFRVLRPVSRILVFLMFIPFFLFFFLLEGIYLNALRKPTGKTGFFSEILSMVRTIGIKIAPYLLVMCIQYVPMFLLEVKPFTSFLGFLIEFFPLITLQFVISTIYSWWFYRLTRLVGPGAVFNALLFAWISADTFPFGTLGLN